MADPIKIIITKMSGEKVPFSPEKLRASLEKSGAGTEDVAFILDDISAMLYEDITTRKIYDRAFQLLRKKSRSNAARYKLKKALVELGPTGYPFEQYIGELMKYQGYDVQVGVIVQGNCVPHEIDVIAQKDNKQLMIECKFHSKQTRRSDIKVPLYIQSRYMDVKKAWSRLPGHENKSYEAWIFTNTRFTTVALDYGACAGLKLIGWDYPNHGSLKDRIDIAGLHPITCLTSLTKMEKGKLLVKKKVLCRELCAEPSLLYDINIKEKRHNTILKEAHAICEVNRVL